MHSLQSVLHALNAAGLDVTMRVLKLDVARGRLLATKVGRTYAVTADAVRQYIKTLPTDWEP
jgi:hypothetical protein